MGGQELMNGGMNRKEYCIPSQFKDICIMILYPPLWVLLKEIYSENPFSNIGRVIINFILTCSFYFPGLIHAMSILRTEGSM
jgi:uncharacterized membrane protein YqaE (UPF0057 family)